MKQVQSGPVFLCDFNSETTQGIFLKRYKRFFADIYLPQSKKTLTVHCPNTGSMKGLSIEGSKALITRSANPKRKLSHTLECLQSGKTWVCVNTIRANSIVKILIRQRLLPGLKRWGKFTSEPRYNDKTRFDFLLESPSDKTPGTYVEVKSVTLSESPGIASFPDAVTERGLKHLQSLHEAGEKGFNIFLVFLIFRGDCSRFTPAVEIDPEYARTLKAIKKAGLKVITPAININKKGFYLQPLQAEIIGF